MSAREKRQFRAEANNDRTWFGMTVLCIGIGVLLGAMTGTSFTALGYGILGALVGTPAALIINITRRFVS